MLWVEFDVRLNGIESSRRVVIGLNGNRALAIVDSSLSEGGRISIDHLDLSIGTGIDVQSLLLRLGDNSLICVGEPLLVGYLGLDDSIFVRIGQINLEQHEGTDLRISFTHFFFQLLSHVFADDGTLLPILRRRIVSGYTKHRISRDPGENGLVVVLQEAVHLGQLVLLELVLEAAVDDKLEAFLGPSSERLLLRGVVIRELKRFVDAWEVNQRVENTNVM